MSRIGTASTRIGSRSVATVVPATFQLDDEAERREREAEHLRAGVAHEHERPAVRPQVERQEAAARQGAEREREDEHRVVRVDGDGVDGEEAECDRGERRGEAVHVVEQVEGVRHPDQPEQRNERRRRRRLWISWTSVPVARTIAGGGELRRELRQRRQSVDVVDEPGDEEEVEPP